MDHQAFAQLVGNYGEFIGAVAVALTLIYLSVQIRHNTNTVAGATEMDLARELTAWHSRISADPELIQLYEKGAMNAPMTATEVARYRWVVAELLWLYEGAYRQYRRGLLPESNWEDVVVVIIGLLRGDALSTWWESRTSALSDDYVAYIDQRRAGDIGVGWHQRSVSD